MTHCITLAASMMRLIYFLFLSFFLNFTLFQGVGRLQRQRVGMRTGVNEMEMRDVKDIRINK